MKDNEEALLKKSFKELGDDITKGLNAIMSANVTTLNKEKLKHKITVLRATKMNTFLEYTRIKKLYESAEKKSDKSVVDKIWQASMKKDMLSFNDSLTKQENRLIELEEKAK